MTKKKVKISLEERFVYISWVSFILGIIINMCIMLKFLFFFFFLSFWKFCNVLKTVKLRKLCTRSSIISQSLMFCVLHACWSGHLLP